MNILSERIVPLAEVKNILKEKKKEYKEGDKELFYEQKRALDHAEKEGKLNMKDFSKFSEEIKELKMELPADQLVKIADLLPETVDDVRAIFSKDRFKYNEEEIKKILEVVAHYR